MTQTAPRDLVIVGGGILGMAALHEAARRGMRPLLLEAGEYGGGASGATQRILHGGLRYLQSFDIGRARESLQERRWFLRTFPERFAHLPCLMPLDGVGLRRPSLVRAATVLDRWIGRSRNDGVMGRLHLPGAQVLSTTAARERCSAVPEDSRGALLWHDGLMLDPVGLIEDVRQKAVALGGECRRGAQAERLGVEYGRVVAVVGREMGAGKPFEIRCSRVLNATGGAWRPLGSATSIPGAVAFGVLVDSPPPMPGGALALRPRGDAACFLLDLDGRTLVGTCHTEGSEGPPTERTVQEFLQRIATTLPARTLDPARVDQVFWGVLPVESKTDPRPLGRARIIDHAGDGAAGFVTATPAKFTTARSAARAALDCL